jgi:DNA repair photolyase
MISQSPPNKYLKIFHRDILTVRSHQWKYYVEPYSSCAFRCTYCLYWQSSANVKCLHPQKDLLPSVAVEIAKMQRKQIVYLGATIDPYQELEESACSTRQILCKLVEKDLPVVILTKSPLILRDLDLLQEIHKRHQLLVQFTLLTTNPDKVRVLEQAAPSAEERLKAASALAHSGIQVHFHLSPVIPGLYETNELHATVRAIADHGGQCIYSNILGMRYRNTGVFFQSMKKLNPEAAARIRSEYKRDGRPDKNVYSPSFDFIYIEMSRLRDICFRNHIDFICEFIPGLDEYDSSRFEKGIFLFGLPAVYQMVPLFGASSERMDWSSFSEKLRNRFEALDDEYLSLLKYYWDDGQLFDNTRIGTEIVEGRRLYFRTSRINSAKGIVLSWD